MKRREFIRKGLISAAALGLAPSLLQGALGMDAESGSSLKNGPWVPQHNWDGYDFGNGPEVPDRLYQGPFPQYSPEDWFGGDVVMQTTPGKQLINCFGMGLTSYISGDLGCPHVDGKTTEQVIDELFRFPLSTKAYIRPTWRHIQKGPGSLEPDDYCRIAIDKAAKYGKKIGFRIMMNDPDILADSLPDYVLSKVPMLKLKGTWKRGPADLRKENLQPDMTNPYFLEYYEDMMRCLSERLNGAAEIEYMDTSLYGFWGEGHTWPYEGNPYPNRDVIEDTLVKMWDIQQKYWTKIPLVTNTQPDFSQVGNSEIVDRTVRSCNWLRTDTIFIENEQIEALANRPAWIAAACECGLTNGREETMRRDASGLPYNEAIISHVKDVGANYFSLWNWHDINPDHLYSYYHQYPDGLDGLATSIGFRVRPSWIWYTDNEKSGTGLILGMKNDGIAAVPGVLRLTLYSEDGTFSTGGCLDPGYPKPVGVRQCFLKLPSGIRWNSGKLRLRAELEYKGVRHPVPFACAQKLNPDGTLTLTKNL